MRLPLALSLIIVTLVIAAAGIVPALAAQQPQVVEPGGGAEFRPGNRIVLKAKDHDEPAQIPPPPSPTGIRAQAARFTVNYSGFTEEAKAAFQYAADIWAQQLNTPVEVVVNAEWAPLGANVLGAAGPGAFVKGFHGAPQAGVWYPIAIANGLAGQDLSTSPDVVAFFSSNFTDWYFGTDGQTPPGKYDFVSVVLHELGHGLGFSGSMEVENGLGIIGFNNDDPFVYDLYAVNGNGLRLLNLFSPSLDLARQLQSGDLYFNGPNAVAANGGRNPELYAPSPYEIGSSFSHLDEDVFPAGDPNSLMTPSLGTNEAIHDPGPITRGMFQDMGWSVTVPSSDPATATPTPTETSTATPTESPTVTVSPSPSSTATPTETATPVTAATETPVATLSPEPGATETPIATPTETPTATPIAAATQTPTSTTSSEPGGTETPTATPSPAPGLTETPIVTATAEPVVSSSPSPSPEVTATYTPTAVGTSARFVYLPAILTGAAAGW